MSDVPYLATDVYTSTITKQIHDCLASVSHDFDTQKAKHSSLTLKDILGDQASGLWWRLYIDPKDWDDAEKFAAAHKKNPGLLYDSQKSKGWYDAMNHVYATRLDGSLNNILGDHSQAFTWDIYLEIWQASTKNVKGSKFADRVNNNPSVQFPGSVTLAHDTLSEKIHHDNNSSNPLVKVLGNKPDPNAGQEGYALRIGINYMYFMGEGGAFLKQGIESVFKMFATDMANAKLRKDQLKAIARAVRNLHIMHAFSDGCGRVNVQTILPAMLLKYGFGLPFGGEHGQTIQRTAQYMMFNGGFSLDDMTKYLWVTQDFGLQSLAKKKPTIISEHDIPTMNSHDSSPSHSGTQPTSHDSRPSHSETQPTSHDSSPSHSRTQPTSHDSHPSHSETQPSSHNSGLSRPGTQPTSLDNNRRPPTSNSNPRPPVQPPVTSRPSTHGTNSKNPTVTGGTSSHKPTRISHINSAGSVILH
jgi:hypothetical protein